MSRWTLQKYKTIMPARALKGSIIFQSIPSYRPKSQTPTLLKTLQATLPWQTKSKTNHQSQGKSVSSTLMHVRYGNPPPPSALRSSSRQFRVSGLTTSRAIFFTSSTLRSKRRMLSRVYKGELELFEGWSFRKRLSSSCGRYDCGFVEPMRR